MLGCSASLGEVLEEKSSDHAYNNTCFIATFTVSGLKLSLYFSANRSEFILGALSNNGTFLGIRFSDICNSDRFILRSGHTFNKLARLVHFFCDNKLIVRKCCANQI